MKWIVLIFVFLFSFLFSYSQNPINDQFKGEKEGDHVEYYTSGGIRSKFRIKNGNLDGDRDYYYENGNFWIKEQFDNGSFNGLNFSLNKNSDTIYIEIYTHDTLLFTNNFFYYPNGHLKNTSTVWFSKDSSMIKNPFRVEKVYDGVIMDLNLIQEKTNNYRIDKKFYRSGQLKIFTELKSKFYDDKCVEYYENGQKRTELLYVKGFRNGPYKEYYISGVLKISAGYKDDQLDGIYTAYDEKGIISKRVNYINGRIQK